jgi:glycosyltransferase involved in cell wall biosynthesis
MVKLLHIGIEATNNIWIAKALKEATIYAEIKPFESDGDIKFLFDSHCPDVVFMQIQRAGAIDIELIKYMSERAVLINWSGDVRDPIPEWFFEFDKYCVTCFSNMRDVEAIGGEYLQIGIDPQIFSPYQKPTGGNDIVFMGNYSGCFPLSQYRLETVQFLRETYKDKFSVFGSWPGAHSNLMNKQHEESYTYSASRVAISISHFSIDRYFSDRLIRAMGSGCFVLSHHYPGIEKDFQIGKHLETFEGVDNLKEKIDYYLANDKDRERIATEGCRHVHANFTTKNMVNDILRIYTKYNEQTNHKKA